MFIDHLNKYNVIQFAVFVWGWVDSKLHKEGLQLYKNKLQVGNGDGDNPYSLDTFY